VLDEAPVFNPPDIDRAHGKGVTRRRITERKPASSKPVQCTGDDQAWTAICALHADSELVAFREDDGTVSIETTGGRVAAQPVDWIIKRGEEDFVLSGSMDGIRLSAAIQKRWPPVKLVLTSGKFRAGDSALPSAVPFLPSPMSQAVWWALCAISYSLSPVFCGRRG